jgi:hypothetical protein
MTTTLKCTQLLLSSLAALSKPRPLPFVNISSYSALVYKHFYITVDLETASKPATLVGGLPV